MTELSALGPVISELALEDPTLGGDLDCNEKTIEKYGIKYAEQSGTSYTLLASDTGKVIITTNSSAVTITLPNNMPLGYVVSFVQKGTGQITFSAASGASIVNASTHTKTSGQYAAVSISVIANSDDVSAEYILMGSTGA